MDLAPIIDEIASRADDFLADATGRREARAGIAELVNADYARLSPADRGEVTDAVMSILEEEDFFTGRPISEGPGPESEDGNPDAM